MILTLILVYLVIIILEVPSMIRNGWRKELLIFSLVFILGIYLTLAQYYQWPLVNPLQAMIDNASRWTSL